MFAHTPHIVILLSILFNRQPVSQWMAARERNLLFSILFCGSLCAGAHALWAGGNSDSQTISISNEFHLLHLNLGTRSVVQIVLDVFGPSTIKLPTNKMFEMKTFSERKCQAVDWNEWMWRRRQIICFRLSKWLHTVTLRMRTFNLSLIRFYTHSLFLHTFPVPVRAYTYVCGRLACSNAMHSVYSFFSRLLFCFRRSEEVRENCFYFEIRPISTYTHIESRADANRCLNRMWSDVCVWNGDAENFDW